MRRPLFALALALLPLVACSPAPPPPAPPPARPPAIVITAGTSGDYPPLSAWTGQSPEGFAPSLLRSFATDTQRDVTFVRFRWPDLGSDLAAKKFEVAADGITVRPERSIAGIYTVPIARGGAVLLLHVASRAKSVDELTIAVNEGGHLEKVARERYPHAKIQTIAGNALRDVLLKHETDAVMTNTFEAPRLMAGIADLTVMGPLTHDTTALWVRGDREDLATALDDWLIASEESGQLSTLRVRMLGDAAAPKTALPLGALFAATRERLALMPFVAAAKTKANLAIDDPAQETRVLAAAQAEVKKAAAALGRPAPPPAEVEAFFRAQFEAAKEIQAHTAAKPATYSLDELRAAIGRITRRMARLYVRLTATDEGVALREAHDVLDDSGLSTPTIARLAAAHARH
jgi:cyclohexadienyl dehydratase